MDQTAIRRESKEFGNCTTTPHFIGCDLQHVLLSDRESFGRASVISARKVRCDFAHDMFLGCCSIGMDQSAFRFTSSARKPPSASIFARSDRFAFILQRSRPESAPLDLAAQCLTHEAPLCSSTSCSSTS